MIRRLAIVLLTHLALSACTSAGLPLLDGSRPLLFEPATPYVEEIAAEAPLGHWRLDGPTPGALSTEIDGAMRFDGTHHHALMIDDFGGGAFAVEMWFGRVSGGTLLSYANSAHTDALAIACASEGLSITFLGRRHQSAVPCRDEARWHHLGLSWNKGDGALIVSIDGVERWRGHEGQGEYLTTGGVLVLGQRQRCLGGCLEEGLRGHLDEVVLHERALHTSRMLGHVLVGQGDRPARPIDAAQPKSIQPQFAHAKAIAHLAFSPDGLTLASASEDRTVRLWDMTTGKLRHVLDAHTAPVAHIVFSPDGRLLASADRGHSVHLWEPHTGDLIHTLDKHTDAALHMAFSPDGLALATAGADQSLKIWDTVTGKTLLEHNDQPLLQPRHLRFDPDDPTVLLVNEWGEVWACDLMSRSIDRRCDVTEGEVHRAAFDQKASRLAVAAFDPEQNTHTLSIWDTRAGTRLDHLGQHPGSGSALAFSPDGERLAATFDTAWSKLAVHDLGRARRLMSPKGPTGARELPRRPEPGAGAPDDQPMAFSPDGERLAVATDNPPGVLLWTLSKGDALRLRGFASPPTEMAFSPDGKLLATGAQTRRDTAIKVWDTATGRQIFHFDARPADLIVTTISPDGRLIATGARGGDVILWDKRTGRPLRTIEQAAGQGQELSALAFSPDGHTLALSAASGGVHLWDTRHGQHLHHARGAPSATDLSFSPNGRLWASNPTRAWSLHQHEGQSTTVDLPGGRTALSTNGRWAVRYTAVSDLSPDLSAADKAAIEATVIDADTGATVATLPTGPLFHAAIGSEGTSLVAVALNGLAETWDIKSAKRTAKLGQRGDPVERVALTYPGGPLFALHRSKTVRVWDPAVSGLALPLPREVRAVAFSPDGLSIAMTTRSGEVLVWWLTRNRPTSLGAHQGEVTDMVYSPEGRQLVTSGVDGTTRVWNLEGASGVTMLAAGDQWLTWSAEGYFGASPEGAKLVAVVQGARTFGIDQLALSHNRPDILIDRLAASGAVDEVFEPFFQARMDAIGLTEGRRVALEQRTQKIREHFHARHARRLQKAQLTEEDVGKQGIDMPQARILHAAPVGDDRLSLELGFRDPRGLKHYQIYINDVPAFEAPRPLDGQRVRLTEAVELSAGANKIEVAALNTRGQESLRALTLVEHSGGVSKGALYFVGFGVSDYKNNDQLPDLQYAHQDALDLADYFRSAGEHFPEVHVHTFTDAEVTPKAIKEARALLEDATVHDTFILFVAGHGIRGEDAEHTYYYLTHGADLDDLPGTAVEFEAIEALLYDSKPRKKLFLMDTCQSGEMDGDAVAGIGQGAEALKARAVGMKRTARPLTGASGATRDLIKGLRRDRFIYRDLARRSGAIVISSSRGEEASLEGPRFENGAFTEGILLALRSEDADTNGDFLVATDELRAYIIEAVPALTEGLQHPTVDRDNLYQSFMLPIIPATERKTDSDAVAFESLQALRQSCDKDQQPAACFQLAEAYLSGVQVTRFPSKARALALRACPQDRGACLKFAGSHLDGDQEASGLARALLDDVCAEEAHCLAWSRKLLDAKEAVLAEALLERACEGRGRAEVCVALGVMRLDEGDPQAALTLFEEHCRFAEDTCHALGERLLEGEDTQSADALFGFVCEGFLPLPCFAAARRYYLGEGVVKDPTRGRALLDSVCHLDSRACYKAAATSRDLIGDEVFGAVSEIACAGGVKAACP